MEKLRNRIDTAIQIAVGLDDVTEELMNTHSPVIDTERLDAIHVSGDYIYLGANIAMKSGMAELIGKIMHEARHVVVHKFLSKWQDIVEEFSGDRVKKLPCDMLCGNGLPDWDLMFKVFNIAGDAVINNDMRHVPVIRDSNGIQFGRYPLSQLPPRSCEIATFHILINDDQIRGEVMEYIKKGMK